MNMPMILRICALLVTFAGIAMHFHARRRFRSAVAPGLWPTIRPGQWRTRREWFSTEYGYRLSRRGAILVSLGGLMGLIASFV
jgi:hypothetical protein